jgi:hypothetical protein
VNPNEQERAGEDGIRQRSCKRCEAIASSLEAVARRREIVEGEA